MNERSFHKIHRTRKYDPKKESLNRNTTLRHYRQRICIDENVPFMGHCPVDMTAGRSHRSLTNLLNRTPREVPEEFFTKFAERAVFDGLNLVVSIACTFRRRSERGLNGGRTRLNGRGGQLWGLVVLSGKGIDVYVQLPAYDH